MLQLAGCKRLDSTVLSYIYPPVAALPCSALPSPCRSLPLWRWLAAYFPARLHKTVDLPPDRPYIFCAHPHGIVSFSVRTRKGEVLVVAACICSAPNQQAGLPCCNFAGRTAAGLRLQKRLPN